MHRSMGLGALSLLALLGGCKSYEPEPLLPERELERLRSLSLSGVEVSSAPPGQEAQGTPHPFDPHDGLNEEETVALALTLNPELRVRRLARGAAEALLVSAGQWPNPAFGVSWMPGIAGAPGVAMDGAWLTEVLRLWERFARIDAAEANTEAADAAILAAEWQLVGRVRLVHLRVRRAVQVQRLLSEQLTLQERALALLRRREEIGQGTALEVSLAELDLLESRRDLLLAESEALAARRALNQLLGLPPELEVPLTGLEAPIRITVFDSLTEAEIDRRLLAGRQELTAQEHAYEGAEHELRLAVYRQYPSLSIGLSFEREAGGNYYAGPGFLIELPIFNRNEGEILAKEVQRDAARAAYRALLHALRAEAHDALGDLRRARIELELQQDRLIPALNRVQALLDEGLRLRQLSTLDWVTARRRAYAVRREFLASLARYQEAVIRLETTTGTMLRENVP